MQPMRLSLLTVGLAAMAGAALADGPGVCGQLFPGRNADVMFVNPDGTPRDPAPGELKALLDAERANHDYEWVHSGDKSGVQSIKLVDHRNPKKQGVVVGRVPMKGSGNKTLANIVLVSVDAAGEGINDPTARSPIGGNAGTTLGAQRLNAEMAAVAFWANRLTSTVDIRVEVDWESQSCSAGGATLGQAGAANGFINFANAPVANTIYHVALANKISGVDNDSGDVDITAGFNKALDESCTFPVDWYYGLDNNAGAGIDFFQVFYHELAHGLCFSTFVDVSTGVRASNFDDVYMLNLRDETLGLGWSAMTNTQRMNSATNNGNLTWSGTSVTSYIASHPTFLTAGVHASGRVRMYAPTTLALGSTVSHFDEAVVPDELMEPIADPNPKNELTRAAFLDMGWTGSLDPASVEEYRKY